VRLRSELNRERRVVEVLQRAFAGEMRPTPDLDVATTYVSATRGATVGGDVFDVFPIDDVRTLIALADVSGKGVEAAIDSTFVKYGLRAFASEHTDPATIVARFNALYVRAQRPPEAFVVLFAGIYDRAAGTLAYVNAGHEAAYIRRPNGVEALLPTDPVIGLSGDARFTVVTTALTSADTLFLSTDGLTEARDPSGAFLGDARVRAWLAAAETGSMNELVAAITQRLRRYTRARSRDDLAIVALRPSPATD
jgi:serine phosphatase RsbU (regulator of sigma subunit)